MNAKTKWIVITTINVPTEAIQVISNLCKANDWNAVVVGDLKTPKNWNYEGIKFLSVEEQTEFEHDFADLLPFNHYCRKNIGYLYAIKNGAQIILETDDDNIPHESFGVNINKKLKGKLVSNNGWVNIYNGYSDDLIWPRGLPLNKIHTHLEYKMNEEAECLIQQYLADDDPDVDAIFRLLFKKKYNFNNLEYPLIMSKDTWCPFNSQNTIFFKEAFSLMYLPSFVSFRMTDIWRSFVAQAALKAHNKRFAFQNASVKQIRNDHNLMKDFDDEIIGYEENNHIKEILEKEILKHNENNSMNLPKTAKDMWIALIENGIIQEKEMSLINQWFKNFNV